MIILEQFHGVSGGNTDGAEPIIPVIPDPIKVSVQAICTYGWKGDLTALALRDDYKRDLAEAGQR